MGRKSKASLIEEAQDYAGLFDEIGSDLTAHSGELEQLDEEEPYEELEAAYEGILQDAADSLAEAMDLHVELEVKLGRRKETKAEAQLRIKKAEERAEAREKRKAEASASYRVDFARAVYYARNGERAAAARHPSGLYGLSRQPLMLLGLPPELAKYWPEVLTPLFDLLVKDSTDQEQIQRLIDRGYDEVLPALESYLEATSSPRPPRRQAGHPNR